jgi:MFS transporter, ACS family, glucarate transporter
MSQKPTRTRYWVVVFAVTLAVLSYIDRVAISQAKGQISSDLSLNKEQFGMVMSAFALGYALFEIPGGFLGDWLGPRSVIARIVVWWSAFTAITGLVNGLQSMWIVRFLFGCGEAGAFPVMTKAFSVWLRPDEKSRAQGIMWTCARLGGAVTPFVVLPILANFGWRNTFFFFGGLGVVWAIIWYWWFRDNPKDHPSVNPAEAKMLEVNAENAESHTNVPWGKLTGSRSVWLLWAQYFLITYPWYFYITWLPTYLTEFRKVDPSQLKILSFLPLAFGAVGCLFCGFILKSLAEKLGSVKRARQTMATIGFIGAALFLFLSTRIEDAVYAVVVMAIGSFFNDLIMPPAWSTCMDVGGKFAGTLSGSMNMMGNFAGFVAPWVGGYLADKYLGDWNPFLYTMVAAYVLGALTWPFIDPVTPLEKQA